MVICISSGKQPMDKLKRIMRALKMEGASHIQVVYWEHKPEHTVVVLKFLVKHEVLMVEPVPAIEVPIIA